MINTMKKSLVLAAAVGALSAIAIPSMASAANWFPVNTVHTLTSPSSITFDIQGVGAPAGFICSSGPTFASQVRTSPSPLMDLTSTTNLSCSGTGAGTWGACTIGVAMIGLPLWSVDGTSGINNVKINSFNIEVTPTGSKPGQTCTAGSATYTVTGTLAGGVWSNLNRSLAFTNGTGLTMKGGALPPAGLSVTVTASEFIKDTTSPFLSL